ncbi:hypothetical protein Q9299_15475 [Gemmobacter fulvus]|uniref:hypothetical protein n=1 Tax=Gemmobacter fulvus TaxID=2840474 RepID=UPI0027966342|nr:hypothetical protein [Gemmobacter fulvus]MDQ1849695.1 hypothetical protein [Gemmobacter fulvus]
MKLFTTAVTALVLVAGVANAASFEGGRERPDFAGVTAANTQGTPVEVKASAVNSTKELSRMGKAADDVVTVSKFPSSGIVDDARGNR